MALPQKYATQTDVPDMLREHYVERDGAWCLQTDPQIEDVTGLKSALGSERELRRKAETELTEHKIKYEGIDTDEVTRLRQRVQGLDDADVYDKQGIEALVTRRTENMKMEQERQLGLKEREITQLKSAVADLTTRWKGDRIETALIAAATKSGVAPYAVSDAVQRGRSIFSDLDESGNVVARDKKDHTGIAVEYGKDGITPLAPEEWLLNLKASGAAPHLWPPSAGGGAPANHAGGGQGIDWQALPPAERLTRYREMQANTTTRR